MANKLKKVFSNKEVSYDVNLNFKDCESYDKFLNALKIVQNEGKTIKLDGVTSIETMVRNEDSVYPFFEQGEIVELMIGPSITEIPFELDTELGKKKLTLNRYYTNQKIVLQTSDNAIVYLKLIFDKETMKSKITYRTHPERAKSINEIVENYCIMLGFFNRLFRQKNDEKSDNCRKEEDAFIKNVKSYFEKESSFYKKLVLMEQELGIVFEPAKLTQDEKSWIELEELYLLLYEKKVLRLNVKLTEMEAAGITVNQQAEEVKIGSALDITFVSSVEYSLWGHKVTLHTANLLSNAIVKEIEKNETDRVKIVYGDEDSRPMYISYRGFKTEEEAKKELGNIMDHKIMYVEALTISDYIK